MGGNALKNSVTRRYQADEYHKLVGRVLEKLRARFPDRRIDAIEAYRNKESFGDMDLLFESDNPNIDLKAVIEDLFGSRDIVKNGNCYSFDYRQFQIDLILTPSHEYDTSSNYFAYNDLGNLCGRLAYSMGVKLGHDGLSYNFREGTYHFKNVLITTDWNRILKFLGLSYDTFKNGFDDLEDVFNFVTSSPFFSTSIFALENRNHAARVRDSKRKTYMEFLDWIDAKDDEWKENHTLEKFTEQQRLDMVFSFFPEFVDTYKATMKEWDDVKRFKELFNGAIISGITGLKEKELGEFMKFVREIMPQESLQRIVLNINPALVQSFIKYLYDKYTGKLTKLEPFVIKTSEEWSLETGVFVLDPDGWDRANFKKSWEELITKEEFDKRVLKSTVTYSRFTN